MTIGRLTQPLIKLMWGSTDLTEYTVGSGPEPIFYGVKVNLQEKDAVPTLEFKFSPSPIAFAAFLDCKNNQVDQPIVLTLGYENGNQLLLKFFYAGCAFSSGHEMDVTVYAVSQTKGAWTNNRVNFTMDKPVPLDGFPDLVKEKCGEACKDIKFQFVGKAAEDAPGIEIKHAAINQAPHKIVVDIARANGMITSINPEGTLVIHYPYNLKGENEKDKANASTKPAYTGLLRNVYILGPGLLNVFTREQKYNLGQTNFDFTNAFTSPVAFEQDNAKVTDTRTAPGATPADQPGGQTSGTTGNAQPTIAQSGTEKTAASLKEARAAWAQQSTTTCNSSFFMVPYVVGIKPRDIVAVPSLNPDNPYYEDWIVEQVTYSQDEGASVEISISGKRPFPGEGRLVDDATDAAIKAVIAANRDTKSWHKLYWNVV
jgi:hypothetical protein